MKKGRVYRAKKLTWLISLITLASSYFMWNYYYSIELGTGVNGFNLLFVIIITFYSLFFLYVILYSIIWIPVELHKNKITKERYNYHYNRALTAFYNKDYDKVKNIYDNRLKNDKNYEEYTNKIKFTYDIVTKI